MDKVGKIFCDRLIGDIKDQVSHCSSTFLLSYSSVSLPEMDSLRKDLKKVNARLHVSKGRLAQLALRGVEQPGLADAVDGQAAFVWSNEDAVTVAKILTRFSKELDGLTVNGGLLEGALLEKADVQRLSDLPSREVLLSQLLATMISPLTRLAGALNAKSRDLLSILKQYSEQKGGN